MSNEQQQRMERLLQIDKVILSAQKLSTLLDMLELTDHEVDVTVKVLALLVDGCRKATPRDEIKRSVMMMICDEMHIALEDL